MTDETWRRVLRIQGEHPIEQVWMHLEKYESVTVARSLIERRAEARGITLGPGRAEAKAIGVAYAVRNAREYFLPAAPEWTKRLLTAYYGLVSFMTGVLIADPALDDDLESIELATQGGHGLKGIAADGEPDLLHAQRTYITSKGFFPRCLTQMGIDPDPLRIKRYIEKWEQLNADEIRRTVPLDALFARVPEIAAIYAEVTGREALCVNIGYHGGNSKERPSVWLRGYGVPLTPAHIRGDLAFPEADLGVHTDTISGEELATATVSSAVGVHWWQALHVYRSPMAPMSWISPVLGSIQEPLLIHFMLMYGLSIVVRYKPKLWREVTEGSLDRYFALVRSYASVVDRVIPQLVLAKLMDMEVATALPGTMHAQL